MKIFYLCQTAKYAALLAGAYHLKKLENNSTYKEFVKYIQNISIQLYEPYLLGKDESGTGVYIIATDMEQNLVAKIIDSFMLTFPNTDMYNTIITDSLVQPNLFLICTLKLSNLWPLKLIFKKLLPFAVWLNRKKVYNTVISTQT